MEENNAGVAEADGGNAGSNGNEGGGNGMERPAWMNSLPDAMKQNERFAQFKEAGEAYAKLDSLLQAEGEALKIPGEDATAEERNEFYQKLGRPENAEGYQFGKPDNWPEGVEYHEGLEAAFKEKAFELGAPDKLAGELFSWYNEMILNEHKAIEDATQKSIDELKNDWKGDKFKVNSELASRAMFNFAKETIGEEKAKEFFDKAIVNGVPIGSHSVMLRIFSAIGSKIADDSGHLGGNGPGGELSPEQAAQKRFPNTKFKS